MYISLSARYYFIGYFSEKQMILKIFQHLKIKILLLKAHTNL